MSRGDRYARSRSWRPYRTESTVKDVPIGPRGELWTVDEALGEIERVYEKVVDKPPVKPQA